MKKKIIKILLIIATIISLIAIILAIYIYNLLNKVKYRDFNNTMVENSEFIDNVELSQQEINENNELYKNIEQINPEDIEWNKTIDLTTNQDIINILLLGEEAIGGGRGRTDSIMIVSLNTKDKKIKLTSLMRDIYLQIPGKSPNRINTAYSFGGVPLAVKTIEETFGIDIYGTVLVNFNSFEKVIDSLGGIDLELTQKEANYLNSTNYISNPSNRVIHSGINHLNGNQTLGYARVRKISGLYGDSDFGRTGRHRAIINAIFNKYKNSSLNDVITITDDVLGEITTDLNKNDILGFVSFILTSNISDIETLRIPIDGGYKGTNINGMSVLVPDWDKNIQTIQNFIYK